jgi:phosphoribosylanthranilate isomerase
LQAVQLHGKESSDFCEELKKTIAPDIEIIKVFSILDDFDFNNLAPFEAVCDYFLFDTKGKLPGGNGTTFDWKVLEKYPSKKPFFLSGGIGIEELAAVKQIIKTDLPVYAIDVNSKFETAPGLKNIKLVREFQQNVKL